MFLTLRLCLPSPLFLIFNSYHLEMPHSTSFISWSVSLPLMTNEPKLLTVSYNIDHAVAKCYKWYICKITVFRLHSSTFFSNTFASLIQLSEFHFDVYFINSSPLDLSTELLESHFYNRRLCIYIYL